MGALNARLLWSVRASEPVSDEFIVREQPFCSSRQADALPMCVGVSGPSVWDWCTAVWKLPPASAL